MRRNFKMAAINAKFMEEKLKRGWQLEDFARQFEITPDDFLELLKKTFSSKAYKNMKLRLDKNDKISQKRLRAKDEEQILEEEKQPIKEYFVEELSSEDIIKELYNEKERLVKEINEKEILHLNLINRRRRIREILKIKQEELQKLQKEIAKHQQETFELAAEYQESSKVMKSLSVSIYQKKERLEEIEKEEKSLKKILVYVYEDGEIESENYETVISESWNEIFTGLMEESVVEMLTIKETKQLAKVITFTNYLKEQNLEYEITFDSNSVQVAYESLKCS